MKKTLRLLSFLILALAMSTGMGTVRADQGNGKGPADCPPPPAREMKHPGPEGMDDEGGMGGRGMMMQRDMLKNVGLTADQESKIEALNADHQKSVIVKSSEIKLIGVDLRTEMEKDKVDMAKINDLAEKMGKARGEMAKLQIIHAGQIASILTKDQRTKMEALMSEHRRKMMERFDGKGPDAARSKK